MSSIHRRYINEIDNVSLIFLTIFLFSGAPVLQFRFIHDISMHNRYIANNSDISINRLSVLDFVSKPNDTPIYPTFSSLDLSLFCFSSCCCNV